MLRRIRQLIALAIHLASIVVRGPDRLLAFEIWWRLVAARLQLYLRPAATIRRLLAESERGGSSYVSPEWLPLFLDIARTHPIGISCLPRSIALRRMLRARSIAAVVVIGVRKNEGSGPRLDGHAWVQVGGAPIGDDPMHVGRYARYDVGLEATNLDFDHN